MEETTEVKQLPHSFLADLSPWGSNPAPHTHTHTLGSAPVPGPAALPSLSPPSFRDLLRLATKPIRPCPLLKTLQTPHCPDQLADRHLTLCFSRTSITPYFLLLIREPMQIGFHCFLLSLLRSSAQTALILGAFPDPLSLDSYPPSFLIVAKYT